jgi:hypothetical protein
MSLYFRSVPIEDSRGKWKQTLVTNAETGKAAFRYTCFKAA